jgi:hypothetical protein
MTDAPNRDWQFPPSLRLPETRALSCSRRARFAESRRRPARFPLPSRSMVSLRAKLSFSRVASGRDCSAATSISIFLSSRFWARCSGPRLSTAGLHRQPRPRSFAFRRHLDGGYSISRLGSTVADIVPDSFRLLPSFFRSWLAQRANLNLRLGRRFVTEWNTPPRRWPCDSPSPLETTRTLDPAPVSKYLKACQKDLAKVFPAFSAAKVARCWGGLIDVTPDAIPVMSDVPQLPGFWIATGFSGHGFGLAPAAGRLMADLVSGRSSQAESASFDYRRFSAAGRHVAGGGN